MRRLSSSGLARVALQVAVLLVLAGVAAGLSAWLRGGLPQTPPADQPEISLEQALGEKPLWIDARTREAFEAEHLPGALPLRTLEWDALLPAVLEQWQPGSTAVVYCDAPAQADSREVAERLRDFKLGPVWVLKGGWKAWKSR